jgi:hypothetical protein
VTPKARNAAIAFQMALRLSLLAVASRVPEWNC